MTAARKRAGERWLGGLEDGSAQAYGEWLQWHAQQRAWLRQAAAPAHSGWRAWRARQMAYCDDQLRPETAQALPHIGLVVELTLGCSVGCSFCGVSAARLQACARPDLDEFLSFLRGLRELGLGGAEGCVLFWATDPFDHPHYERFAETFEAAMGYFPSTTTALPLRDPARTRALLARGARSNQFSVLSRAQLEKIHGEFSAEELSQVTLALQYPGSRQWRSRAGKGLDDPEALEQSTIACVSGLWVQWAEGRWRWISPCPADAQHPDGFRCWHEERFQSAAEALGQLEGWLRHPMFAPRLALDQAVSWRPDLRRAEDVLQGTFRQYRVPEWTRCLQQPQSPAALALAMESRQSMAQTLHELQQLWAGGLLELA